MTPTNTYHIGLYRSIKLQQRNRWDNWPGYFNPNPLTTLPTLAVTSTSGMSSARLYTEDGASSQDVSSCFSTTVIAMPNGLGNVNSHATNTTTIPTPITKGKYYLLLVIDGVSWYSDLIFFCDSVTGYTKIEFSHTSDFWVNDRTLAKASVIPADYVQKIYLNSDVGRPSYPYNEEVKEFNGIVKPKQQVSYKQNKIIAVIPEYVSDALRLVRLMDDVSVTYGGIEYECDEFLMGNPSWQVGELGNVEIEFKTDTVTVINGRR